MTAPEHIVLIHGTWGSGDAWTEARAAFEARGFTVHTPTLRHHDLPLMAGARKIATLSLNDYVDDLVQFVRTLDSPPILAGLSMGGLLAQLVAARVPHAGLISGSPAPAAGIWGAYPSTTAVVASHYLQLRPWAKPFMPTWERWSKGVANEQSRQFQEEFFTQLVTESGRAYCEMAFPWFDRKNAAVVDFSAITGPVLVLGAENDRIIHPRIARATARRYPQAEYIEVPGSDHMMFFGKFLPMTMRYVDHWLLDHQMSHRR